ncbi:MAG: carboxypeptidase regulatory-like domain-containing protein [Armatimonadota bacterium]
MRGYGRRLCRVLTILPAGFGLAAEAYAQSVRFQGSVLTPTERPLSEVEVTVLELSRTALSDSAGHFEFGPLPLGEYVVRVRRIGFKGQYFSLRLEASRPKDIQIVMEPGTYQLPELKVVARSLKPIEYAYTRKYDDFFRYRNLGLGFFKTRAQFEKLNPLRTADLLGGIPRIRVRHQAFESPLVWIAGCNRLGIYIDGSLQYPVEGTSGDRLDRLLPSQIEMIAVFRGPAEMPAEAAMFAYNDCAIMIWTR